MIKQTLSFLLAAAVVGCSAQKPVGVAAVDEQLLAEIVAVEPEEATPKYQWELVGASMQERMAMEAFQDRGITDRLALATLMGNIKHESLFKPDICEGGARVPYEQCHRGGFGLIQWTTVNRYNGLGEFCRKYDCNPSTTEGQLRYLFNERQWLRVEEVFKTPGQSIEWYTEEGAYPWLGWGIHGARTDYAYDYARWMTSTS